MTTDEVLAKLIAACTAALAYDEAIQIRAETGNYAKNITGVGGQAEGYDLDALYDDWITKSEDALEAAKEIRP